MIGAYIHVPFCRTLCPYCDFFSVDIAGSVPSAYVEALIQEIRSFPKTRGLLSIFFGGGTPSLIDESGLAAIMDALRNKFRVPAECEITVEANPDDVTAELVETWKRAGINRVSLGVQGFNDETLRYLGRRHDAAAAAVACRLVGESFGNWEIRRTSSPRPLSSAS